VPARLVTGFVEREVNGLLGLDAEKEGALVLAPLGREGAPAAIAPVIAPLTHRVVPLSSREEDYPALRDAYANSSLESEAEVLDWREAVGGEISSTISGSPEMAPALPHSADTPLPPPSPTSPRSLGETIVRRGSTRQFSGEAITAQELSSALYHGARGWVADAPGSSVELFVNVHAVEGIEPGAYHYAREAHALTRLRAGDFRGESAFLTLEQALGGASSATVFFLADLRRLLARWGNRGYRLANLEAGYAGGRLYLAAYAQGFGATGLTFYDRAVVDFFSPAAAGLDAIFVTALGRSIAGRPRTLVAPPAPPRP
jgi:SagB-type dehydrogenase family enzyme